MKIKPAHFDVLRTAVAQLDTSFHRERYKAAELSDKRYRWDLLYHAQRKNIVPEHFVCDTLYIYANDDHLDTALRRLVPTLYPKQ
jgi:hypothetical protein